MNLSGVALAEIRTRFEALRCASSQRRWLKALRSDSRRGARSLADTLERRARASRREDRRLAKMWSRQRALHAKGVRAVAGVDEVGVGPLAGPVVAAAVILPVGVNLPGLNDSKCLSRPARERLDERQQLEAAKGLLIDELADDKRWVIDWMCQDLTPVEQDLLLDLEKSFSESPASAATTSA